MTKTEIFIEKALKKQGEKYIYTKTEYVSYKEEVIITCKKHGDFEQTPENHLKGRGCKKCARDITAEKLKASMEDILKRVNEVHPNTYDYSKVEYISMNKPVEIVCPVHGSFFKV